MGKGICKFCKEEINYLDYERKVLVGSTYELVKFDGKELSEYNENEIFDDTAKEKGYFCPSCNEKLADTEEEAFSFLSQIDELEKTIIEKLKNINENKKHTL